MEKMIRLGRGDVRATTFEDGKVLAVELRGRENQLLPLHLSASRWWTRGTLYFKPDPEKPKRVVGK